MKEIRLAAYNPAWPKLFAQEAKALKKIFKDLSIAIYHKGSTSVPAVPAEVSISGKH